MNIGVIGYGYWGPNLVRNFAAIEAIEKIAVCDQNPNALAKLPRTFSNITTCTDCKEITDSAAIDAVVVATPVSTHFELAKRALQNGKHVFVEKPFTASSKRAEELINLADQKGLTIMVDHTFLFTGAVRKIKELTDAGSLGKLCYYDSTRINLGLFQHDINVIWDLAPHDLSIMDFVVKNRPVALTASGLGHFNPSIENIAYITVYCQDDFIAHFNVNWYSPVKLRTTLIGGQQKMLVWNDLAADDKIRIFDKGVDVSSQDGIRNLLISYRSGDMWSPRVNHAEALHVEAGYFVDCITRKITPINDGLAGLRIVRMLEASDESIKNRGRVVEL